MEHESVDYKSLINEEQGEIFSVLSKIVNDLQIEPEKFSHVMAVACMAFSAGCSWLASKQNHEQISRYPH